MPISTAIRTRTDLEAEIGETTRMPKLDILASIAVTVIAQHEGGDPGRLPNPRVEM